MTLSLLSSLQLCRQLHQTGSVKFHLTSRPETTPAAARPSLTGGTPAHGRDWREGKAEASTRLLLSHPVYTLTNTGCLQGANYPNYKTQRPQALSSGQADQGLGPGNVLGGCPAWERQDTGLPTGLGGWP